jgi:hypothetical protein
MAGQNVLVPYNFTANDQKALDFVIRTFAHQENAEITLFNAYTPPPQIDMRGSPIMEKMASNLNYLTRKMHEQEVGLKSAKETLVKNGFSEKQVHYVFSPISKDIAGDIADFCMKERFDMLVLNRKTGKVGRFFTGSVFEKVVTALKDTIVCIVT